MNDEKEKLSHLLDEYSSDNFEQKSLDDLLDDVNQQYCFSRYQMIGQVMRHELPEKIETGFSRNVMAVIREIDAENQSILVQKKAKSIWRWELLKPLAGMAVAASVAIVSITLWQSVSSTSDFSASDASIASVELQKIDLLVNQTIQAAVPASTTLGNVNRNNNGMHWKVIRDAPGLERKLNAYLINHTEYSKSMQGLIPQARVAGYGSEK
ncbi:MAG: negative regulator of sigma E activity [Gammaproteobacteria bacterium]|jgi:negative regulator of sigma E activity